MAVFRPSRSLFRADTTLISVARTAALASPGFSVSDESVAPFSSAWQSFGSRR